MGGDWMWEGRDREDICVIRGNKRLGKEGRDETVKMGKGGEEKWMRRT